MDRSPALRASDVERERAVAALRRGAAEGRLTVEELDDRSERAYGARTREELDALLADLPAPPPRAAARQAPAHVDPGGFGRQPFTFVFEYPVAPAKAMDAALRTLAPAMGRGGYTLVERDEERLVFEYSYRPGWVVLPVLLVPVVGLVALAYKERDRVVVELQPARDGGTRLIARGSAPRRVRRAFAELAP